MSLLSPRKRILLIGGDGVVLFGPVAGGIEREIALSWDSPDFDEHLTDVLGKQHQQSPMLLLFDGADQTYRKEENVPKLSIFDRKRFIERKLEQAFPSYPIRTSIEIPPPRVRGPKGMPSYLFAAIPEIERSDRVVENVLEAAVPLAGFGLLPAESQGLVTAVAGNLFGKKGDMSRWAVLIGQHETGGLRQVVVKDGNLALTRMTPASEAGIRGPEWAEEVLREFKATLTYIARFGYKPEDGIDIVMVCGDAEKQYFENKHLPVTNFQCITPLEALTAIGMGKGETFEEVNYADALHAAWASKKKSLAVPVKVPSVERIIKPRLVVRLATIALALAFLVLGYFTLTGYQVYDTVKKDAEIARLQKSGLEADLQQRVKDIDALPAKPAVIRAIMTTKKLLENNTIDIALTLEALHKVFAGAVGLESFSFEHRPAVALKLESAGNAAPGNSASAGKAKENDRGSVRITFQFKFIERLTLEKKVQRSALLVEDLRKAFPGYLVRIKTQFGGISSADGKFAGVAGGAELAAGQKDTDFAEFEMEGAPL